MCCFMKQKLFSVNLTFIFSMQSVYQETLKIFVAPKKKVRSLKHIYTVYSN